MSRTKTETLTLQQLREMRDAKPVSKYSARRTQGAWGLMYDSKAEAQRSLELEQLLKLGLISALCHKPRFYLPGGVCAEMDFSYMAKDVLDSGPDYLVIEDVKGMDTPVSALKRKQVEEIHRVKVTLIRRKS